MNYQKYSQKHHLIETMHIQYAQYHGNDMRLMKQLCEAVCAFPCVQLI